MDLPGGSGGLGDGADGPALYPVMSSAIASILTGTALVATRFVVSQADGLTIATLRYVLAAACLLPLAPSFRRFDIARSDVPPILALGVLYFGLFPWCISAAMQYTTASEGAIVLASTPAMTLLIGILRGSESWSVYKGFGVAFAVLGAAVAYEGTDLGLAANVSLGNALMVLATVSGAVYTVYSKPFVAKYSPLTVTSIAMAAGAVALSLVWLFGDRAIGAPRLDAPGWLAILYVGIAGGALSFFLYAWALGRAAPTTVMILLPLNPIAALVVGSLWLGEPLGLGLIGGLLLVIIGVILVVRPSDGLAAPRGPWWKRSQ
jgi:drug/metabolite transporter (DMT)-like permease